MRRIAAGLGAGLALLMAGNAAAQDRLKINWDVSAAGTADGKLSIAILYGSDYATSRSGRIEDYPEVEKTAFTAATPAQVRFRLRREAGTLECEGIGGRGTGTGHCTFQGSATFRAGLTDRGILAPNPLQELRMALSNVTLAYADEIAGVGIKEDEPDQWIRLRNHAIRASYVESLRRAGVPSLDANRVVRLSNHAIDASFVAGLSDAGVRDLATDGLVRMRNHGVDAAFVREMRAAGATDLAPERLIFYRKRGYRQD